MFEPARRVFLAFSLAVATVFALDFGAAQQAHAYITTEAKYAAIVMDASSGEVLYERNADAPRYPASITKTMTIYLTFEALAQGRLHLDDQVPFSAHAVAQAPSRLGARVGESITVDEALRALTVKSANDVAVALAERVGGSESKFAALMTLKAQELGMSNTRYVNANGLPDARQITTARDIAVLWRAVMRDYPQYYSYFGVKSFVYKGQTIGSHNDLLLHTRGVDGSKTGFTNAAGFNIVASAVRDNRRLITVVMGGNSKAARDSHADDLVDAGFLVMRRRAQGQQTTIAQNLFEAAPIGTIMRPPTEEGSADQEGLKIVLTNQQGSLTDAELASLHAAEAPPAVKSTPPDSSADVAAPPRPAKFIRAKAEKLDADAIRKHMRDSDRADARPVKDGGEWFIQIGAYRGRSQAAAQLAAIRRKYAEQLKAGRPKIQPAGHGYYRARIVGLSEQAAQRACVLISAHKTACDVYQPDA
jgi:D-alanyl-D-alanine carboxypeptidase (penicillin-binding protein 5/6)